MNKWVAVSAVLVLCGGFLLGCSNTDGASGKQSSEGKIDPSADAPEFTGPYAAEFADAYARTESELARKILADGKITESEFIEIREAEKSCLEDAGFTDVIYNSDGTSQAKAPEGINDDDAGELHKQCATESGSALVQAIYNSMQVNPNNEDWDSLTAACLIDTGVVDSSFTVEELNSWYENQDPRLSVQGEARECTTDPLGLLND